MTETPAPETLASEIVRLDGAQLSYPSPEGEIAILQGIDLKVNAGEIVAVTGPSGSGKSSLIALIGGLERATGGAVKVLGTDLGRADEATRTRLRRRHDITGHRPVTRRTPNHEVLIVQSRLKLRFPTEQAHPLRLDTVDIGRVPEILREDEPNDLLTSVRERVPILDLPKIRSRELAEMIRELRRIIDLNTLVDR